MSDRTDAILDAAERRIRLAGYSGFSFREIAADVGVKSSSVHHHFPTKELLAAAVTRRYTERFRQAVERRLEGGDDAIDAWRRTFRDALAEGGRMCLCGALGASASDLPAEVAIETQRFFDSGIRSLASQSGSSRTSALRVMAVLEGAMLVATALGDVSAFDQATEELGK